MKKTVQPDSRIRWRYQLFLADGQLVEASEDPQGDLLQLGQDEIHHNLEQVLTGLPEGEKNRLVILAEAGFGYRDPEAIQQLPRERFPDDYELKENQVISFSLPSGQEIPGQILEVGDAAVKVDFNHPLAGHNISIELEILEILPD